MSLARIMLASVLAGSIVAAPALSVASLSDGATEPVEPTIEQPDVDLRASTAITRIDPEGPFSMVALTWDVDDAPSAVEVRVLAAKGGWSEWTMLDVAEEPAEPGTIEARDSRPSTEPLWTGSSTAVEVRAVDDDGAGTPRLELIDPGVAPQDDDIGQQAPGAANASVAEPSIITRKQWGADESLRNCTPRIASSLKAAVVHHTAGSNNYSPADSAAIVRGIYAFHTQSRGWCDVGYNVLVDRWGNVFEGRSGGVDSPVIGAHTGGFNTGTMGISMMGTFTSAQPPADMLESVARVIAWKFDRAGIDPQANVTLVSGGNSKFSRGTQVTVRTISGHRDLYATECPGGVAHQGLQALRDRTETLTAAAPDVDVAVPVVQVSGSADRSSSVVLDGATVAGEMFAFVAPQQGVSAVSFYLDDPELGSPVQVEGQAPWDLGGTAAGGAAAPFDVSGLAVGEHTLTALVTTSAGQQTVTASFTVEEAEEQPPADPTPDVDVAVPVVQVSGSADRSSSVVLDGATVAGEMFAFVAPQQGVSAVSFYLDDPELGSPVQVEGQAPWDLGGTAAGGAAAPFDVSGLAVGEHTLTALVTTSAGQQTVTASFTVEEAEEQPPADPTPDVDVAVPVVQVSGSADRSSSVVLDGATVAGEMFAFVAPQQGVSAVSFYLDDPELGSPVQVEGQAPWDLGGTAAGGAAAPFDVSGLAVGEHTLTALVTTSAGQQTVTASFTVEEAEEQPPADPTPDVDVAVPVVQVSGSADRSSSVVLDGATVAGEMFAFVAPQQGVSAVSFYLDDPELGSPVQVEGQAPWDLGGTAAGGAAAPFDVSGLAVGEHTLTALVTTSAGQQTVAATFAVAGLQVSGSADRSSSVVLDGATVAGEMFAFVAPQQGVSAVSFYLDDPELGSPVQVEGQAPWDLGGTAAGGAAAPFDVSGLAVGEHTLTALVTTSAGQQTVAATFAVAGLQVSGSAGRSSSVVLDGATVAGEMFAFVAPQQGVSAVSFYLDDPELGSPVQVEGQAPWDLGGTAAGGAAAPFDVSGLAVGEHTLTALVTTSAGQQTVAATFAVAGLQVSGSAGRSSSVVLDGATVAGEMFAFVAPQQGVSAVSFYLDDPELGSPVQVEGQAPWDLGGTAAGGAAAPFDVSGLAVGEHTLTALVTTSAGQQTVTASFTVERVLPANSPPTVESGAARAIFESAGFTGDALDIALGVAYAESAGFADAVGDYWQIIPSHTVAAGESLAPIARTYRTTTSSLASLNGISGPDYTIYPGQRLWNPTYQQRFDFSGVRRYPTWDDGWVDPIGSAVWGPSVGLFQVRTLHDPQNYGAESFVRNIAGLRAPAFQARAAFVISKGGTDWSPWSVYRNGAYRQYLGTDFEVRTGHPEAARWNLAGTR